MGRGKRRNICYSILSRSDCIIAGSCMGRTYWSFTYQIISTPHGRNQRAKTWFGQMKYWGWWQTFVRTFRTRKLKTKQTVCPRSHQITSLFVCQRKIELNNIELESFRLWIDWSCYDQRSAEKQRNPSGAAWFTRHYASTTNQQMN